LSGISIGGYERLKMNEKAKRKDYRIIRKNHVLIDGIQAEILGKLKPRKHFVYVHMRATDAKVFYVGQGVNSRYKGGYRGELWKNVARKYGVLIGIVSENLTKEKADNLEIGLIREIGRRDLGLGYLVNHTDGGDGGVGMVVSPERRAKQSALSKGIANSNADLAEYTFVNIKTKEEMTCTRVEFKIRVGCSCAVLFCKNPQKTKKDWYLKNHLPEEDLMKALVKYKGDSNPNADTQVYKFLHTLTGEFFEGTRVGFKDKYAISPQHLFDTVAAKTVKKWKLVN